MRTEVAQRLRATFGVGGALVYTSVLDMGRLWERLLRRAKVPLAYTRGFSPHPRLQFAAPLPVGYSSECEVVDVFLAEPMIPLDLTQATRAQAPQGLSISRVEEALLRASSLQATMRGAHYRVRIWSPERQSHIEAAVRDILDRTQIIRQRVKKGRMRDYDLRPLIDDVSVSASDGDTHTLYMVLRCGPHGSGRPEEIVREMDVNVSHYTIHRCRLLWGDAGES